MDRRRSISSRKRGAWRGFYKNSSKENERAKKEEKQ